MTLNSFYQNSITLLFSVLAEPVLIKITVPLKFLNKTRNLTASTSRLQIIFNFPNKISIWIAKFTLFWFEAYRDVGCLLSHVYCTVNQTNKQKTKWTSPWPDQCSFSANILVHVKQWNYFFVYWIAISNLFHPLFKTLCLYW